MQKTKGVIYCSRLAAQSLIPVILTKLSPSEAVQINGPVTGKQYN